MSIYSLGIITLSLAILYSCNSAQEKKQEKSTQEMANLNVLNPDKHSYSQISEVNTSHLALDLTVDFEKKIISGSANHTINNSTQANQVIFDVNSLDIQRVELDYGEETTFKLGEVDELIGQSLTVDITPTTKNVTIYYATSPDSKALQWLNPQQTADKIYPYLFTQGEAVLTRTWIPCQDTPANRITYSAAIQVPKELMAVMSADNPTDKNEEGKYHFEMKNAIPCYLIALAVGDFEFASLGSRTGVYAEKSMLEKSVYEFADVEKMIQVAEELYGEYQWGRYDIIVLPPSFPFGGMENPKLTFATPTILAGDRSLVSLIAHELAHSWSGNLVTNATWDDFWLNEGFTVYFENRIMEAMFGKDYSDMLFSIEFDELKKENKAILESEFPGDTKLKLDLEGRDPDEGMTTIPYIKGALFLMTLEKVVGREKFDVFVKDYFDDHEFKTMTTEAFITYLNTNLLHPNKIEFNTDEWIYGEGIPENCVNIVSNRFSLVEKESQLVPTLKNTKALEEASKEWSTQEWMHFIRQIPDSTPVAQFSSLDKTFKFKNCGNSEIMSEWYIKSIRNGYDEINADMELFLTNVGRRKFLEPIYTELTKTEKGLALAKKIYKTARPNYHSISYLTVDEILKWEE
jgi:aminopeptidase N